MSRIIDLRAFRKANNLSQKYIAEVLGVTSGFISLIENGRGKLPSGKREKLLRLADENGWKTEDLNPDEARIQLLFDALQGVDRNLADCLSSVLTPQILKEIHLGKQGIDTTLANKIISVCPKGNRPSKGWLLSGEGDMFSSEPIGEPEIRDILTRVLEKEDLILREINEIKESMTKKPDSTSPVHNPVGPTQKFLSFLRKYFVL